MCERFTAASCSGSEPTRTLHTGPIDAALAIIEAIELGREATIHGNVLNRGWIDNLPDGCVEVGPTRALTARN